MTIDRAARYGGYWIVDIVATTPMCSEAAVSIGTSGTGSFFGAMSPYLRVVSIDPP